MGGQGPQIRDQRAHKAFFRLNVRGNVLPLMARYFLILSGMTSALLHPDQIEMQTIHPRNYLRQLEETVPTLE